MTFDPFNNRVSFGLLSKEEKAILQAEGPWERYNDFNRSWVSVRGDSDWFSYYTYRRTKPTVIMPTVDWSCFGDGVKAVAADKDGRVFAYNTCDLEVHGNAWGHRDVASYTRYSHVDWSFAPHAYNRGTCDWKDSLVLRPTGA